MKITVYENGPFMVNTYLVENEELNTSIVIDPGYDIAGLIDEIKTKRSRLAAVVCTHGHIDHISGVAAFTGEFNVPFYINELERGLLERAPTHARMFGVPDPGVPLEFENLQASGELALGGMTFTLLHTPGHSPGSISLYGDNAVFSGDALFNMSIGRTDLPGGDYSLLIGSIKEKIFSLPGDTVVLPGHGPSTTVEAEKSMNPFF